MEYLNGLMENNIKDIGKMENNMEKEFQQIENKEKLKLNGLKEKGSENEISPQYY